MKWEGVDLYLPLDTKPIKESYLPDGVDAVSTEGGQWLWKKWSACVLLAGPTLVNSVVVERDVVLVLCTRHGLSLHAVASLLLPTPLAPAEVRTRSGPGLSPDLS